MKRATWQRFVEGAAARAFVREMKAAPAPRVTLIHRAGQPLFVQHAPNGEGAAISLRAGQYRAAIYRTPQVQP